MGLADFFGSAGYYSKEHELNQLQYELLINGSFKKSVMHD